MNVPDMLEVLALAVGLGLDAMSVCMSVGVRWHGGRQKFRLAWHMGLFQFLMPVAGWLVGQEASTLLAGVGAYVASGLLAAVGGKMLYEALKAHPGLAAERAEGMADKHDPAGRDPTRGWSLVALSVATSLDALVVGFSLGLKQHNIVLTSIVIGVVAAIMALAGVVIGRRIGKALGKYAEILGAVILVALAVVFLFV